MLSVNFQPPQIKADAKSESVLPNAGRGSGRAGGKATFLQFLHPKKDPKSGQVAKDAELASGTRSTVKAVLNETKPSRPPVARPKNSPAKAEAKSAGKGSKHAAATKKKSNVAEDRDAPVAALGQAQQQIATQLAAKFSLVAKAKTLNKSENTKVAGQLMPTEATSKNQAGKLVKSIRVTTSGKVNLLETSKVSAAKVSSKAEIQSFAKPIKTAVDGSSNSLEPKERSSGGKSKNFKATGTKNLAQAVTHGKNKSAESTKTVLEPRKQPAPTIVNVGDTRGGRSAKTVQHRVSQERPSGENAPRVSVTQGAAKHQLSDAPKVTSAGKPVTVQDRLKLFSLKEGRDVAQPGRRVSLGKVAQSATKPDQAPVQGSFPDATKKNHSSRQEPQVQKKASEPVATKRQISNAVSPPASLKPKHVAVSKPQAAHPSKIHQPAAKTKIEPLGQARSKGLPTEIGLKVSNGASVSVAVGQEIKKEKAESPLKPVVSQKTKIYQKAHSDRISTSSIGELNEKSEGVDRSKLKTLTNTGVKTEGKTEGKNYSEKNGVESNLTAPKLSVRHFGLQETSVSDAGSKKEPIGQLPRYQVDGKKQNILSSAVPSSPKSKTVEVSKLASVLKSITQAVNTDSPAKFDNRGLRHQPAPIQRNQKVPAPSTSLSTADGEKLKTLNNTEPQATNSQLFKAQYLRAMLKPKKQHVSVGTQTRTVQRGLKQSITNPRKAQRVGSMENKTGSGGMEAAFLKSEMKLAGKMELSNDVPRQNVPLGESFASNGAKNHLSMAAEMLEAGRSDLSHIKDIAVRNDLASRLNQMEVDLQSVQSKSIQAKGQPAARAIVYREIMSAVESFRGMNSARWAMTIEPFDSLRIQLDLRMTDSQLVVQARLDRGSQALLSSGWNELQASLAEKDVDLKSLITNGQKEGSGTLFNGKNGRQSDGTQPDDESWFSEELGELMAEFEKEAQKPRKAKHTNRKARMLDATFESWA